MAAAIKARVAKGSFLVHDKWLATVKAVETLGFQAAPPVNHSSGFRNRQGWHSNDIESEFARLKGWLRKRYAKLPTQNKGPDSCGDMCEYMFYVNHARTFSDVLNVLSAPKWQGSSSG